MKDSGINWVGNIPQNWRVMPIKYLKASEDRAFVDGPFGSNLKSEHFVEEGDVYVIESGCISTGKFIYKNFKTITNEHFLTIDRSECKEKDIIIAKIGANYGMAAELPLLDKKSVVSGNSLKLTLDSEKMDNYLFVREMELAKKSGGFINSVNETAQPALSLTILNNFRLVVPPIKEQKAISYYLKMKCNEIDELLTNIQIQMDMLEEYKRSVITEVVTRGLNPNVEMKDSNIFYLGKVKHDWSLTKIGYVCTKLNRVFEPSDVALICSNKGKVLVRGENVVGIMASEDNAMQGIKKNDIAIHGMDTWHGAIALSDYEGKITRVVHVCDSTEDKRFIVYWLQYLAFQGVYKLISNGVRGNTSDFRSWDKVKDIYIALPSREEQKVICDYLDKVCSEVDMIVDVKRQQLNVLEEYKKAIIYEYVTGKKEVV